MPLLKIFCILVSIQLSSVAFGAGSEPPGAKPVVTVSVEPLALIVREICSDACEVLTLVPKGVSEHSWQPGPKDIVKAKKAAAAIGIGIGFDERWLEKIGYAMPMVLWLGKLLDPMPWWSDDMTGKNHEGHDHGNSHEHHADRGLENLDPHVWVDARRMSLAATAIGTHLAKVIPAGAAGFQSRSTAIADRLLKLQIQVEVRRKAWRTRPVVMFHDLAGYFARRFNLPVLTISAGDSGHDLSAKMIADVARRFKTASIAAVLTEKEDGAAKTLARELKSKVKVVDFSASKSYRSWDDWYLHVVSSWEDVLKSQ